MFGKNFSYLIVVSIAAVTMTVAPASATTITTYSTLASWQAMTSGEALMDFNTGILGNAAVQFSGLGGFAIAIDDPAANSWQNFGTGKAAYVFINSTTSVPYIHIALLTPVNAFGLNVFSANPNALVFTISADTASTYLKGNGTPYSVATNAIGNPPAFFGVTSDTPITFIDLTLQGAPLSSWEFVDNFRTAQAMDPTPEAATFLLIGSGLVGIMALRKRTVKHKPAPQTNPVLVGQASWPVFPPTFPNTRIAQ